MSHIHKHLRRPILARRLISHDTRTKLISMTQGPLQTLTRNLGTTPSRQSLTTNVNNLRPPHINQHRLSMERHTIRISIPQLRIQYLTGPRTNISRRLRRITHLSIRPIRHAKHRRPIPSPSITRQRPNTILTLSSHRIYRQRRRARALRPIGHLRRITRIGGVLIMKIQLSFAHLSPIRPPTPMIRRIITHSPNSKLITRRISRILSHLSTQITPTPRLIKQRTRNLLTNRVPMNFGHLYSNR